MYALAVRSCCERLHPLSSGPRTPSHTLSTAPARCSPTATPFSISIAYKHVSSAPAEISSTRRDDTNVPGATLRLPTPMPRPSKAVTARASTPSKRLQSLVSRRDRLGGLGAGHTHQRFAAIELHQDVQLGSIRPIERPPLRPPGHR